MKSQPKSRSGKSRKKIRPLPAELAQVNLDAAGIDVGSRSHWVAVPEALSPEQTVREFGHFTQDLEALSDWLVQIGVSTVAMESTGVYWISLFEVLEARGLKVLLVNARHVKNVPGRKTDVLDCQWLQRLHTFGLLRGAFRPPEHLCILRSYLRQREALITGAAVHIQHMQKALTQMNLPLQTVVSDITGVSGMKIIHAILDGQRDPNVLASFRDRRCKHDEITIAKALCGHYRKDHLFALEQSTRLYEFQRQQIVSCEGAIEQHLSLFEIQSEHKREFSANVRRTTRKTLSFDAHIELYRITGVDLTRIDGISAMTALKVISEIGLDMRCWPSVKHFTSWLGLCPGNKVSGGKQLSTRTKPSKNRAANALRLAAQSLYRSKSALGAYFRRQRIRLGTPKAITAAAHKLARLIYGMLKHGTEYIDRGQDHYEQQFNERRIKNLKRQAKSLGLDVVEASSMELQVI